MSFIGSRTESMPVYAYSRLRTLRKSLLLSQIERNRLAVFAQPENNLTVLELAGALRRHFFLLPVHMGNREPLRLSYATGSLYFRRTLSRYAFAASSAFLLPPIFRSEKSFGSRTLPFL